MRKLPYIFQLTSVRFFAILLLAWMRPFPIWNAAHCVETAEGQCIYVFLAFSSDSLHRSGVNHSLSFVIHSLSCSLCFHLIQIPLRKPEVSFLYCYCRCCRWCCSISSYHLQFSDTQNVHTACNFHWNPCCADDVCIVYTVCVFRLYSVWPKKPFHMRCTHAICYILVSFIHFAIFGWHFPRTLAQFMKCLMFAEWEKHLERIQANFIVCSAYICREYEYRRRERTWDFDVCVLVYVYKRTIIKEKLFIFVPLLWMRVSSV